MKANKQIQTLQIIKKILKQKSIKVQKYKIQKMSISTTSNYLQQITNNLNEQDLNGITELFKVALTGTTTQSQRKVFEMLKQIESKTQTYLYFLYIFLNPNYEESLRYMAGTTMKSSLQRNSKQLHFEQSQKTIIKTALLSQIIVTSHKLKSMQNILISQLAICFEQIDWKLIYFLIQKLGQNPQIITLLCTIFEDLKHNSQNSCYYQGAVQTQVIEKLLSAVHEYILSIVSKINFTVSLLNNHHNHHNHSLNTNQQLAHLANSFKLIRTITFHLPLKLSQYFDTYTKVIVIPLLKQLSVVFNNKQCISTMTNYNNSHKVAQYKNSQQSTLHYLRSCLIQFFQSINEISQTKSKYLLANSQFLDQFILYFPISQDHFRKSFPEVIKIWTNVILELLINDQPQNSQGQDESDLDRTKLKMFNYLEVIVPRVLTGFRYTKQDQKNIFHQMELEHNPYGMQESLNKQQLSDEEDNFESTHGKAHGSTLRKISITCVQKLCQQYQNDFWETYKPFAYQLLKNSSDYKSQQSAIVFIGIIAQNDIQDLRADANQILQYLSQIQTRLQHQIVMASTLWTFEKLLPAYSDSEESKKYIYQLIYKIMGNKDQYKALQKQKNLMVKQAAVSLLDQLLSQESSIDLIILQTMTQCLMNALESFTGRALFNVFKAISSIFEQQQRDSQNQNILVREVVNKLCLKWGSSITKDSIMCPLIECLSLICENRKKQFIQYSQQILHQIYPLFKEATERKSLVLRVIDLATSIIISAKQFPESQGFKKIQQIVSSDEFLNMVSSLILSQQKQIRHFGYGLLSDITKLNKISNSVADNFIQTIAKSMDRSNSTSINNALMCLTDIIDTHKEIGINYIDQLLSVIVQFICKFPNSNLPKIYLLNFSRMFGRLGLIDWSKAKQFLVSGNGLIKQISEGLRSQQKSQLTLNAYRGLIITVKSFTQNQLLQLIQTKEIQIFIDSFMGYRYNLQSENMTEMLGIFNMIQSLLAKRNVLWQNYLNSTCLYPATINRILHLTQ